MTRHLTIIAALMLVSNLTFANEDRYNTQVIKEYSLDTNTVYNIPIGNTPTTITFPSQLTSIDGANISNNPTDNAPVLISYVDGHYFFSVRAVQPKARAAVNVVHQNQTYVFNFYNQDDTAPYRTVRLINVDEPTSHANNSRNTKHAIHA